MGEPVPCELAKEKLVTAIAAIGRSEQDLILRAKKQQSEAIIEEEDEVQLNESESDESDGDKNNDDVTLSNSALQKLLKDASACNPSKFRSWTFEILKRVLKSEDARIAAGRVGHRFNVMINHEFACRLVRFCDVAPMWSGLCASFFGSTTTTATSARTESYFKSKFKKNEN